MYFYMNLLKYSISKVSDSIQTHGLDEGHMKELVCGPDKAHRLAPNAGFSLQRSSSVGATCSVYPGVAVQAACNAYKSSSLACCVQYTTAVAPCVAHGTWGWSGAHAV